MIGLIGHIDLLMREWKMAWQIRADIVVDMGK